MRDRLVFIKNVIVSEWFFVLIIRGSKLLPSPLSKLEMTPLSLKRIKFALHTDLKLKITNPNNLSTISQKFKP